MDEKKPEKKRGRPKGTSMKTSNYKRATVPATKLRKFIAAMDGRPLRGRGAPRKNPDYDGLDVLRLVAYGLPLRIVAAELDTSLSTLTANYEKEITLGKERFEGTLRKRALAMVMSEGNFAALKYLMSIQCGISDRPPQPNFQTILNVHENVEDLDALNEEQIVERFHRVQRELAALRSAPSPEIIEKP